MADSQALSIAAVEPPKRASLALWISIAVLLLAIAIALGPVVVGGFSAWDDESTISQNPALNPPTWAGLARRWTWPHMHIYIPLIHTVWNALAAISPPPAAGVSGNFAAWPFKLANLSAHTIASVLVLLILRRLVGRSWIALAGAMVFAVHPLQVEAVAWASGLKDVMFGMFSAGCILAYLDLAEERGAPRGKFVMLSLLLFVLAGLSKPMAIVLPAMLLAFDLCAGRPVAKSVARIVPFAFIGLAFAMLAYRIQPAVVQSDLPRLLIRPIVALDVASFYGWKFLVPTNLAFDYGRTATVILADVRATSWRIAIEGVFIVGLIAGAWSLKRRAPLFGLGLIWIALPLGPVFGFTYFDFSHFSIVADHYVYLPMLGVALAIAVLLQRGESSRVAMIAATAVVVLWSILAARQSLRWRDADAVTTQTLHVNPGSYASWDARAVVELRAGRLDEAEQYARHAVELSADDGQAMFVLATILTQRSDHDDEAIALLRKAIAISPYGAPFHHRLAVLLGRNGKAADSLAELEKAVEIDPDLPRAKADLDQMRAFVRASAATRPIER